MCVIRRVDAMRLPIKNMVCRHCIECVRRILADDLHLTVKSVELGDAEIEDSLTDKELAAVSAALETEGFRLIHSREAEIIEDIKHTLIGSIWNNDGELRRVSLQSMLDGRYGLSYASLSRLFSEIEGRSLENYYINLRVERVKELIRYHNLSLSEIAWMTGYSSPAHLSRQFKKMTGLTTSEFKELGCRRTPLPEV